MAFRNFLLDRKAAPGSKLGPIMGAHFAPFQRR